MKGVAIVEPLLMRSKRWLNYLLIMSIMLIVSLLVTKPAYATFPAKNGNLIVFQSDRVNGVSDIFVMNTDGSNVVNLTTDNPLDRDESPSWSPDGKKIAYAKRVNGNFNIYVMNADGTNKIRLTNITAPQRDWFPSWSPDGKKIIFLRTDPDVFNNHVFVMNADGSNVQQLNFGPIGGSGYFPRYSPDGTKIIYQVVTLDFSASAVYIMNADGTNPQPYTVPGVEAGNPDWSPNGKRIIFIDYFVSDVSDFFIGKYFKNQSPLVPITRDQALRVTAEASGNYEGATYSPDGKYLLIMAEPGADLNTATLRNDVYMSRVNDPTHTLINLTNNGTLYADRYPSMQPAGPLDKPNDDEDGDNASDNN